MAQLYGNPWAGDGLYNIRVGKYGAKVSYRFVAPRNGQVNALRYFNTYSLKPDGTVDRPGYHSGTGGQIRIQLQTDDGSGAHIPSGVPLTTGYVTKPLEVSKFLLVSLDKAATLVAGQIYHIVFENYDPTPEINHVSVNTMSVLKPRTTSIEQPGLIPYDMQTLVKFSGENWKLFKSDLTVTPIFTLFYNTQVVVPGYGGMESWMASQVRIAGAVRVRQRFTSDTDRPVRNIVIRLAKLGTPGALQVALKTLAGQVRALVSVPASSIPDVDPTVLPGTDLGHDWVVVPLPEQKIIQAGVTHCVELSASGSAGSYTIYPLRDGGLGFGFAPVWSNAYAEQSVDSGATWTGWTAYNVPNIKLGHLQMYFNE